jgi:hypothetical protein
MKIAWSAAAALLLALATRADAGNAITGIPEIGPHYRVVTFEKNIHPQNQLVVYTRLDAQCRVLRDPKRGNQPTLEYYWLMDGARYKRVNALILRGIRKRLQVEASPPKSRGGSFSVRLKELDAVEHDLGATPLLWIEARKTADGCAAEARITLGPSDKNAVIRLDTIYSEAALKGLFDAEVKLIALKGSNLKTGKPVVRVYRAK